MTAIINTIWGGKVCQIVDRQITRKLPVANSQVVDSESNKVCILLASDALVSIAYTGVAVAKQVWFDCVVANCLAHRKLSFAMAQSGSAYLGRPISVLISELAINLNGKLNSDSRARLYDLRLSVVGWHLGRKLTPLAWELDRGAPQENGFRYFNLIRHPVGKFLRQWPRGFWADTLGDVGSSIDESIGALETTVGCTHDDVERYLGDAVLQRSTETKTVSPDCIAVQLDPRDHDGQVQVTYYPSRSSAVGFPLLSPWILTPRLITAPTKMSSIALPTSSCGKFIVGGFKDGVTNLNVRTRLPVQAKQNGNVGRISWSFQPRPKPR